MRPLLAIAAGCVALALLGGGCSSTPARFYTLSPAASTSSPPAPSAKSVSIGPLSVPSLVDRPQLVLGAGANQVRIDEFSRWAAPLADNITNVLVANLAQRLGTTEVWAYGQAMRPAADLQVTVQVQRFDIVLSESVLIEARWSVQARDGAPRSARSLVREPLAGSDIDAAVAAQSRALERLSDDIARMLRGS